MRKHMKKAQSLPTIVMAIAIVILIAVIISIAFAKFPTTGNVVSQSSASTSSNINSLRVTTFYLTKSVSQYPSLAWRSELTEADCSVKFREDYFFGDAQECSIINVDMIPPSSPSREYRQYRPYSVLRAECRCRY